MQIERRELIEVKRTPTGWDARFSDEPKYGWIPTAFTPRASFNYVRERLAELNPNHSIWEVGCYRGA